MRILVLGAGQGGTCLLVEAVRGLDLVEFSRFVEDRMFFSYKTLPENYGTKLTTDSIGGIDIDNFSNFPKAVLQRSRKKFRNGKPKRKPTCDCSFLQCV